MVGCVRNREGTDLTSLNGGKSDFLIAWGGGAGQPVKGPQEGTVGQRKVFLVGCLKHCPNRLLIVLFFYFADHLLAKS